MFSCVIFFFFNDTATTEIYTLSLHDALPISGGLRQVPFNRAGADSSPSLAIPHSHPPHRPPVVLRSAFVVLALLADRKSTRLNSSHANISYAVFCLKKKKKSSEQTSYPISKL